MEMILNRDDAATVLTDITNGFNRLTTFFDGWEPGEIRDQWLADIAAARSHIAGLECKELRRVNQETQLSA